MGRRTVVGAASQIRLDFIQTRWVTVATGFWLYGLHRVSVLPYWGRGRLRLRAVRSVRTMASCMWGLDEGVRREYILHGDIELP